RVVARVPDFDCVDSRPYFRRNAIACQDRMRHNRELRHALCHRHEFARCFGRDPPAQPQREQMKTDMAHKTEFKTRDEPDGRIGSGPTVLDVCIPLIRAEIFGVVCKPNKPDPSFRSKIAQLLWRIEPVMGITGMHMEHTHPPRVHRAIRISSGHWPSRDTRAVTTTPPAAPEASHSAGRYNRSYASTMRSTLKSRNARRRAAAPSAARRASSGSSLASAWAIAPA